MEDNTMNSFEFDIPAHHKSIIKVIGVGGGGSNAVNLEPILKLGKMPRLKIRKRLGTCSARTQKWYL
jgi:hypothetical protein